MDKENSFGKLPEGVDEEQAKAMKKMGDAMQAQMRQEQNKKVKNFKQLNAIAKKGGILFTGSSLMEQFPVCEMCMDAGFMEPVYGNVVGVCVMTGCLGLYLAAWYLGKRMLEIEV